MHERTHRNIADRQGIANADWCLGTAHDGSPHLQTARCNDVAPFTIGITHQSKVRRAVWVIFNPLNFGWNTIFGAKEINHPVMMLVATALVAGCDMTIVVAARMLELRFQQWSEGLTLVQMVTRNLHHATTAWGSWFHFDNGHDYAASLPRLSSCPGLSIT